MIFSKINLHFVTSNQISTSQWTKRLLHQTKYLHPNGPKVCHIKPNIYIPMDQKTYIKPNIYIPMGQKTITSNQISTSQWTKRPSHQTKYLHLSGPEDCHIKPNVYISMGQKTVTSNQISTSQWTKRLSHQTKYLHPNGPKDISKMSNDCLVKTETHLAEMFLRHLKDSFFVNLNSI